MASGRVERRIQRPDTWQLRPAVHQVNKALANTEPSTHGAKQISQPIEWLLYSAVVHLFTLFMVTPIFNTLMRIDRSLVEAARDAGASAWHLWRSSSAHRNRGRSRVRWRHEPQHQ